MRWMTHRRSRRPVMSRLAEMADGTLATIEDTEPMIDIRHEEERRSVLERLMGSRPIPLPPPPLYMRPSEIAEVLQCSRWTVLRKLKQGLIPDAGELAPGYWLVKRATFEAWLRDRIGRIGGREAAPDALNAAPDAPSAPEIVPPPKAAKQAVRGAPRLRRRGNRARKRRRAK